MKQLLTVAIYMATILIVNSHGFWQQPLPTIQRESFYRSERRQPKKPAPIQPTKSTRKTCSSTLQSPQATLKVTPQAVPQGAPKVTPQSAPKVATDKPAETSQNIIVGNSNQVYGGGNMIKGNTNNVDGDRNGIKGNNFRVEGDDNVMIDSQAN